jgi:putative oxidoreductase
MQRVGRIALWVCQAVPALVFLFAGTAKFTSPLWPRMFARWGYPDHFYLVIGMVEVAAGVALLVPRLAAPASLVLLVVMAGAGLTHLVHDELRRMPEILVISTLLAIVAYGRWKEAAWVKGRPTLA